MTKLDVYPLHDLLKKIFGFDSFKGNQEAIIKSVLDGENTFVIMPTGGGKSMCYQLPAIMNKNLFLCCRRSTLYIRMGT